MSQLIAFLITCYGLGGQQALDALTGPKSLAEITIDHDEHFQPTDLCVEWRWDLGLQLEIASR